jgi:Tol biopolymer transport system component
MPRIADALQRESQTVELEQGGFERLLARRERKQRNRRIREGVLAVIVALAVAAVLLRSFSTASVPAVQPKPVGAGEVLLAGTSLGARDPDSGAARTIVDVDSLPSAPGEEITGAAWSYDHNWVAFRRGTGSQSGDLWIADTTGGAPRRLARDVGWSPWVWSPTGDQIVFVLGRDATLVDAATGRETDLGTIVGAEDSEGYAVHALVWSPDGTQVVYDGGPGSGAVYAIDVETGEHSLLVPRPAGMSNIEDIDWSPDGAHVAITYVDASNFRHGAMYVANADGSGLHPVNRNPGDPWPVWMPGLSVGTVWSPDGTRLAYSTLSGPDHQKLRIWTVPADGSDGSLVTSRCCVTGGGSLAWSPDGSQIGFGTEGEGGDQVGGIITAYHVVNADGTGEQRELDRFMYQSWDGGWFFCFCYG